MNESSDVPERGGFVVWAMGSPARAAAVVILPVLGGVVLGIVATLLHFGMRYPALMWTIPWDLTAHYECFVLPRNIVRCCLLIAPLASALILVTQPRFRPSTVEGGSAAHAIAPPVDLAYWPIVAVGLLLMIVIPSAFDVFGAGWEFACRIEDLYGLGGRIVLTALIVLVAPAPAIAALTIAYSIRRRIAPASLPEAGAKALNAIGRVMIAVGLLCLAYAAWTVRTDPGNSVVTGIEYIAAGMLIAKGSMGTARLMGWMSAAEMVIAVGNTLSAPLWMPLGLAEIKFHIAPLATIFAVALFLASFGYSVWIYQAVRAPAILAARKAAGRSTAPPWTGFALGVAIVGFAIVGVVRTQTGDIADEARRLARTKYGARYNFLVTGIGYGTRETNHVFVSLTGYNEHEVIDAQVDWKP